MNDDRGTGARPVVRAVVLAAVVVALSEALFFSCLASFRHPRSLAAFGMPWVLVPGLPALGALAALALNWRRPAGVRVAAVARGAQVLALVLLACGALAALLDNGLSD